MLVHVCDLPSAWLNLSHGSHWCGFAIMLLQRDFKAADQCDLHLQFHWGLWLHLKEVYESRTESPKKVVQKTFLKLLLLESQWFERFHCQQQGSTCHVILNCQITRQSAPVWTRAKNLQQLLFSQTFVLKLNFWKYSEPKWKKKKISDLEM